MWSVLSTVVAPVLVVAAVGGWVGNRLGFSLETLSKAVFSLFSPCLVYSSLATLDLAGGQVARLMAVAVVVFAANAVVAVGWGAMRGADPGVRSTNLLSATVVNQGNMGLPIATLAFGQEGLRLAVVTMVVGVVLWSSAGIALASFVSGTHGARAALVAPFRYPSVYAAAAGTLVNVLGVRMPAVIAESTHTLGQASIPCMLVVLGLQFRRPDLSHLVEPLAVGVNRLLVGPLVGWGAATAFGLGGLGQSTAILQSGMPSAVMTTILARELAGRPELAVNTVLVTTLLSIPTLTVLVTLLR